MRCAKCGFNNVDGAKTCAKCGTPLASSGYSALNDQSKTRRVIKLSSDIDEPSTPNERPWEVRVKRHDEPARGNSGRIPTQRRRPESTGKIPAIKHPASETGKIPVEQRTSNVAKRAAVAGVGGAAVAGTPKRPSPNDTTPIDLDDMPAAERQSAPHPRRAQRYDAETVTVGKRNSGRMRMLVIIIALLIIICLIALGVFFATSGDKTKTVTFDTDGGTQMETLYVEPDGVVERPDNPTRSGYSFDGWYLDPDFEERALFPLDVTQDLTIYAKWERAGSATSLPGANATTAPGGITNDANAGSSSAGQTNNGNATGGSTANRGSGSNTGGSSSDSSGSSASSGSSNSGNSAGSGTSGGNSGGSSSSANTGNNSTITNGTVQLSLTASNGATLSGDVRLHDGFVIPNSSEKAYSIEELRALGLNDAEMCIARNEPYARQGYSFRNPGLQAYFNARSWYHNTGWRGELPQGSAGYVTAHNLKTIEEQSPSAARWLSLRTY